MNWEEWAGTIFGCAGLAVSIGVHVQLSGEVMQAMSR
jgi:hypothetical protein